MQDIESRIRANPKFTEFVNTRNSYSTVMTIIGMVVYYGFVLLVAFDKELLAKKLGEGMTTSLGVPLGVGVIAFTIVLTWIYVRRANTEFDDTNESIIKEARK